MKIILDTFEECISEFILMKMDHDCAIDTNECNQLKKSRDWSVKDFMSRIKHLNNFTEYMPLPTAEADEADRVPKFTDAELRNILKKAGPKEWRESQVRSNLRFETTIQQVQYYEGLRNLEKKKPGNSNDKKSHGSGKYNHKKSKGGASNGFIPCPIRNGSHDMRSCRTIKSEANKFANRGQGNGSDNNRSSSDSSSNRSGNVRNHGYNTRNSRNRNNNQQRHENNNISQGSYRSSSQRSNPNESNGSSDSEDNYEIEEELNVLSEDQVDDSIKNVTDALRISEEPVLPKGTDVRVVLPLSPVIGLLDSGATNTFIRKSVLKNFPHSTSKVNVKVKGRYSSTSIKEQATFDVRLPDFDATKSVKVTAFVEDSGCVVGRHAIVFGSTFLQELGITFDYSRGTITWDDVSTTMKTISQAEINSINDDDPADVDLPDFMKNATKKAASIKPNIYDTYNYHDMVLRCEHLTKEQQDSLISLFSDYEELFSGKLGTVPGPPIKLKLKPNAVPFCARAFTVPKAIEHIAKNEVNDLVKIGVLVKGVHSAWASPSFFRPKKDGRLRFVSDLRKLNACLERHPHPLPLVEEVIWKMNGFAFATC